MINTKNDKAFLQRAVDLASQHSQDGLHGPFGAVIVKDGSVIAEGWNQVVSGNDPTAHAEVVAIRKACEKSNEYSLQGCTLYASCEPCPMCLSAIIWARIGRLVFAQSRHDAAAAGFDDERIYQAFAADGQNEFLIKEQLLLPESEQPFVQWLGNPDKTEY